MGNFEQVGESMLLVQEGNRQIATAISAAFRGMAVNFKNWLANMPTTLPPIESFPRK